MPQVNDDTAGRLKVYSRAVLRVLVLIVAAVVIGVWLVGRNSLGWLSANVLFR
jgi:hypothetical protein